jgi:hypothetical protein
MARAAAMLFRLLAAVCASLALLGLCANLAAAQRTTSSGSGGANPAAVICRESISQLPGFLGDPSACAGCAARTSAGP